MMTPGIHTPIASRVYLMAAAFGVFYGAGWNKLSCLQSIESLPPSPLTKRLVYQITGREQVTDGLSGSTPVYQRQAYQDNDSREGIRDWEGHGHRNEDNHSTDRKEANMLDDGLHDDIPSRLRSHRDLRHATSESCESSHITNQNVATEDVGSRWGNMKHSDGAYGGDADGGRYDRGGGSTGRWERRGDEWGDNSGDTFPSSPFHREDDRSRYQFGRTFNDGEDQEAPQPQTFEQRRNSHREKVRAEREEAISQQRLATAHLQEETQRFSRVRRGDDRTHASHTSDWQQDS